MTFMTAQNSFWEFSAEALCQLTATDPSTDQFSGEMDKFDFVEQSSCELGQELYAGMDLREGLALDFSAFYVLDDDEPIEMREREHPLEYRFSWTEGNLKSPLEYDIWGSGLAPDETEYPSASQDRRCYINVHMEPDLFCAYTGSSGELPPTFQEFVRPDTQIYYHGNGRATVAMQKIVQQILHCPYHGLTRRMYLDAKATELMVLMVEHEAEKLQGRGVVQTLKPADVERIYYARDILLSELNHPPSLFELAQQVGLNEYKLKLGFREAFGTTVFNYLHHYRLEQAKQRLIQGDLSIAEVARSVGFASRGYFAKAFRDKFGCNPSQMKSK